MGIEDLKNTLKNLDISNIYALIHPTTEEYNMRCSL